MPTSSPPQPFNSPCCCVTLPSWRVDCLPIASPYRLRTPRIFRPCSTTARSASTSAMDATSVIEERLCLSLGRVYPQRRAARRQGTANHDHRPQHVPGKSAPAAAAELALIILKWRADRIASHAKSAISVWWTRYSRASGRRTASRRGESTFMVEMLESALILNNIRPQLIVLLDEIGRGTSTYDGISSPGR